MTEILEKSGNFMREKSGNFMRGKKWEPCIYYKVKKWFKKFSFVVVLKNLFVMELGTFPPVPQLDINLHFFSTCGIELR